MIKFLVSRTLDLYFSEYPLARAGAGALVANCVARQLNLGQKTVLAITAASFITTYTLVNTVPLYLAGSCHDATTQMMLESRDRFDHYDHYPSEHAAPGIIECVEIPLATKCCSNGGIELCCDLFKRLFTCYDTANTMPTIYSAARVNVCVIKGLLDFIPTGMANAWANLNACFASGNLECYVLNNHIFECFATNQSIEPVGYAIKGSLECLDSIN